MLITLFYVGIYVSINEVKALSPTYPFTVALGFLAAMSAIHISDTPAEPPVKHTAPIHWSIGTGNLSASGSSNGLFFISPRLLTAFTPLLINPFDRLKSAFLLLLGYHMLTPNIPPPKEDTVLEPAKPSA